MRKKESCRRIEALAFAFLLTLSFAVSACGGDTVDDGDGYSKYIFHNGGVKFSLEYPPSYLPPREDIDQSENPVHVAFDLLHPAGDPARDAYIWVDLITPTKNFPDYRTSIEFDLGAVQGGQAKDQFQLVERSPVTVDGAQGERVVYRFIWRTLAEESTPLGGRPAITYAAYFEHGGFLWSIGVKSRAYRADEAKADFEHVVRSFKFLD